MLIANRRKIRFSQFLYASLVLSLAFLALIPITIQINAILIQNDSSSDVVFEYTEREQMIAVSGLESVIINNLLIILFPLLLGVLTIFYYIPTMNSLGLTKLKGKKQIRINKYRLPEYGYTIPVDKIQIRIKRKLNSFKGLLLRELDFLIILPIDYKEDKRIFDFLACEQIFFTSNQIILRKTVDIQNIPLLCVRTQAIISPSK